MTPCCVIAFPFGTCTPEAKAFEAADAASKGAREIDMVINVGAIKSGDWKLVKRDIEGVVNAVRGPRGRQGHHRGLPADRRGKGQGLHLREAGRRRLRQDLHGLFHRRRDRRGHPPHARNGRPELGVKASGGVRTYEDAIAMIEAGAKPHRCLRHRQDHCGRKKIKNLQNRD